MRDETAGLRGTLRIPFCDYVCDPWGASTGDPYPTTSGCSDYRSDICTVALGGDCLTDPSLFVPISSWPVVKCQEILSMGAATCK